MNKHLLNFKYTARYSVWGCLLLCLLFSCNKNEFMPLPVGEAVPFVDSLSTFETYIKQSPEYSLFWQAWRRSTMGKTLNEIGPSYGFTLFVADNTAMEKAGYNSNTIRTTPVPVLDTLLRLHTIPQQVFPDALALQPGNLRLESLLQIVLAKDEWQNELTFRYRHYLAIEKGRVLINAQPAGLVSSIAVIQKGTIIPVNKVLVRRPKDTHQVLYEDGRFSMYLGIRRYNDSLYNIIRGFSPSDFHSNPDTYDKRFGLSYTGNTPVKQLLDYLSPATYTYIKHLASFEKYIQVYETTILVPTDEAFRHAGFQRLENLIAFNQRAIPYLKEDGQEFSGWLPTDSLLSAHYWGFNIVGNNPPPEQPTLFYSNDLKPEIMSDYVFKTYYNSHINPLDFTREGEAIHVKVKGSTAEQATIIEKDIETFNGVVHVLNRLLVPPGFKLN